MKSLRSKNFVDTSLTDFEMSDSQSLDHSNVSIMKASSYSASSFSHHDENEFSDSDDDVVSLRLNSSKDDLTEEEVLDDIIDDESTSATRFDSAIDLSVASLDRVPSVARSKRLNCNCRCKCHQGRTSKRTSRASLLSCPKQKPLQVSISFPIYTDGSYTDPRNLPGRSSWFVDTEMPRPSHYEPTCFANTNSNNNRGPQIVTSSNSNKIKVNDINQKTDQTYQLARKTYSKKTTLMSRNKWLCVLIIILAVVTLATVGALVYFGKWNDYK